MLIDRTIHLSSDIVRVGLVEYGLKILIQFKKHNCNLFEKKHFFVLNYNLNCFFSLDHFSAISRNGFAVFEMHCQNCSLILFKYF